MTQQATASPAPGTETDPSRLLRQIFGFDGFRPGQEEIVEAVTAGRNTLAIMPTHGLTPQRYRNDVSAGCSNGIRKNFR